MGSDAGDPGRPDPRALIAGRLDVAQDVSRALEELCVAAVRELRVMGAVVTLMAHGGSEAVVAVSDEAVRALEAVQFATGEGPGLDAFASGRPVLMSDLEHGSAYWPGYAPAAVEAGVGASYAFPVQLGASRFGVLTFYSDRPRVLTAKETAACLDLAEAATQTLLEGVAPGPGRSPATALSQALHFRNEVYQAQGMVMVDLGVSLADALSRMRAHAFANGQELDELASQIIAGTTRLSEAGEE